MQQQSQTQSEQLYTTLTQRVSSEASATAQIVRYNYLQPAWYRTKPWLDWTAHQCGTAAVFTLEKTCDYAPIVADGVLRGGASACRKTKRAANATHALWSGYWYGGSSHPDWDETGATTRGLAGGEHNKGNASIAVAEENDDAWAIPCDEVQTVSEPDEQNKEAEDSSDDVQVIAIAND